MNKPVLNPSKQKRRLAWLLLLFFLTLSAPVYYLLQTVYTQLKNEAHFTARHQAETLVDQIEINLQLLLETEQNRPIAEYQFFNVMENPLLSETSGVKFSPLSVVPPHTDIKGLIGYFQINTDGSFHLPALPELGQDNISGLSLSELQSRLQLKQKLRGLLSIKLSASNQSIADEKKPSFEKNKAKSIDAEKPYIKEFLQQKLNSAEELEHSFSSKKNSIKAIKHRSSKDYNDLIQENDFGSQKLSKSLKKYKTRKELVQIPDQTMASSYFNRQQKQSNSALPKPEILDKSLKENVLSLKKTIDSNSAIQILSYETEVTPLQLLLIGQDYFCFFRYVWHDNNRYTQGFIVNNHEFLLSIAQPLINSYVFNNLLFTSQGNLIHKINNHPTEQEYSVYNRILSMPYQKMEVTVNAAKLTDVPGGLLIDLLALSIICIFFLAFIFFYRLGSRQIDLTKQQQNFISAVSHELKTPLTSIRMYGEMLRSGWVSDESKKQAYYDFIFFESERLSRLITNVLQLARLGHQQQLNTEVISTTAQSLLNRIASRVEAQIEASSFQLNIIQPISTNQQIHIKIDEDAFFQIVINLLDNAIKFASTAKNKSVDIRFELSKNKHYVIFYIRDYGPGINNKQRKKIFHLFYRCGDELTRTAPGTGIGLALVAQLVQSMHASIEVINKHPGAEFQIKIPVLSAPSM